MRVYLTENDGWALTDIYAQSWKQAEDLKRLFWPECEIIGELVCKYDVETSQIEYIWGHERKET